MDLIQQLADGFRYPFRGIRWVLSNRPLLVVAAIPILINTLLYLLFGWLTFKYLGPAIADLLPVGEGWWWDLLRGFFYVVLGLIYLFLVVFTFVAVGSLIASPFNDLLAERTEKLLGHQPVEVAFGLGILLREAGYLLKHETFKLLFFGLCMGGLMLINLIPVAGSIFYAILNPLVTITFLTLTYTDVIMSRHHLAFGEKWRTLQGHWGYTLGFGAGVFLILFIPLLNFMLIGGAVVGATLMVLQRMTPPQAEDTTVGTES